MCGGGGGGVEIGVFGVVYVCGCVCGRGESGVCGCLWGGVSVCTEMYDSHSFSRLKLHAVLEIAHFYRYI